MAARSDKLHQKRGQEHFKRRSPVKAQRNKVLIVCEGSVAEPNYLKSLVSDLRLTHTVNICGKECSNDPLYMYQFAMSELLQNWHDTRCDDYDKVFCVFDKDRHVHYDAAVQAINNKPVYESLGKTAEIAAITSIPCFEVWVLLHFEYTDSAFSKKANIVKRIKKHYPEYNTRTARDLYPFLKPTLNDALQNAKKLSENAATAASDNPSTKMHELVDYLIAQSNL
jgi:hypothetical protein